MRGLYKKAPVVASLLGPKKAPERMELAVERAETDAPLESNNDVAEPVLDKLAVGFDKVAYQREYMRKRRAAAKCK